MLLQIFTLYIESLLLTMLVILIVLGLWIGLRALSGVDKTAKARQAHLFDMMMIWCINNSCAILCNDESIVSNQGIILV